MAQIFRSVKTKLALTVAAIVLFFAALLITLTYGLMRDTAQRNAAELADTVLEETDTHITRFFQSMKEITLSFAAHPAVYTIDVTRMRELVLSNVWARRNYMRAIYLGTVDGSMYEWGYGPGFDDNTPTFPPDYDPRLRPWYQFGMETDGFAVTDPYLYASIDEYGITCVLPVDHPSGQRVGILGVDIMVDRLSTLVSDFKISMNGKVILIDRRGQPLVNQFTSIQGDEITDLFGSYTDQSRTGRFVAQADGMSFVFSYKKNELTGWTIFVGLPLSSIMASTNNTIRISAALNLLLMILLLIALEWSSRQLVIEPVEHMVRTIGRLRAGEVGARFALARTDEFGLLERSFNSLADRVEEYNREMERKVKERTARLQALQQENLRLRIIEEKERIYGYLHDSLGARLTNIVISNNVARSAVGLDPTIRADMHHRIEENAQAGLTDLKEILSGSHDSERRMIDFGTVLEVQVRRLALKGITFSFTGNIDELNLLPRSIAFEIEKILQELASNVLKHAEATAVNLSMEVTVSGLYVEFCDNGVGFQFDSIGPDSFGLLSIRNRVERIGGTYHVTSVEGGGTTVMIEIPLEPELHEND